MSQSINIPNQQLYKYHLDITAMQGSVQGVFFHAKIKDFYKNNSLRLNSLLNLLNGLREKYFELDDKGGTKIGEDNNPVFKEGLDKDGYAKEHIELMRVMTVMVI